MNTRKKNEERADLQSRRLEDELVEDMDWKDDPAIEIARNARKAEARAKQKHYLNNEMVRCLMIEIFNLLGRGSSHAIAPFIISSFQA